MSSGNECPLALSHALTEHRLPANAPGSPVTRTNRAQVTCKRSRQPMSSGKTFSSLSWRSSTCSDQHKIDNWFLTPKQSTMMVISGRTDQHKLGFQSDQCTHLRHCSQLSRHLKAGLKTHLFMQYLSGAYMLQFDCNGVHWFDGQPSLTSVTICINLIEGKVWL